MSIHGDARPVHLESTKITARGKQEMLAIGIADRRDEWPPDPLIAGNVLVRLKKARGYLRDAMRGLDSAEEENLATPKWRRQVRLKVIDVLAETQNLIRDVREVLEDDGDDDAGIP